MSVEGEPTLSPAAAPGMLDLALALVALLVFDVALFHLPAYSRLVAPNSASGRTETQVRRLQHALDAEPGGAEQPTGPRVLILGNSVTRHGVQEGLLQSLLDWGPDTPRVLNLAVPAMNVEAWRTVWLDHFADLPPATVVLGVNALPMAPNRSLDRETQLTKTQARVTELLRTARAAQPLEDRLRIGASAFYRTPLFRSDLRDFLSNPAGRLRELALPQPTWPMEEQSLQDLADAELVQHDGDWQLRSQSRPNLPKLHFARHLRNAMLRQRKNREPDRQFGDRMVSALRQLVTELEEQGHRPVIAILPETPFPAGDTGQEVARQLRAIFASGDDEVAVFYDPPLLAELSAPRFFRDNIHLNKPGADRFTEQLAAYLQSTTPPALLTVAKTSPGRTRAAGPNSPFPAP